MVTINPGKSTWAIAAGIITGLVGGAVYNRWSGIKRLIFSADFFGRKTFVPSSRRAVWLRPLFSVTSGAGQHGIHAGGEWIVPQARFGFRYLWRNRLLIPVCIRY